MHVPVLAGPAIEWLNVRADGTYVDCTAGAGGHSALIAERLRSGRLISLDCDPSAVTLARERLKSFKYATVVHRNYSELAEVLAELNMGPVDGILIDAGLSSIQLDARGRGFTFQQDGPLDMRMDSSAGPTAAEYLSAVDETELARVLKLYGDIPRARTVAKAICSMRPLATTGDLVEAVRAAFPFVTGVPDEVRTVFQAVRIAVNDELTRLDRGLESALDALAPGGRLVGITFHSGEDRVLKQVLRDASRPQRRLLPDGRTGSVTAPRMTLLTNKPIVPASDELRANPRARSAKLRAAERSREGE